MHKRNKRIPVNTLPPGTREGIMIDRMSLNGPPHAGTADESHRDNGHLFILQEKGRTHIEVDFTEQIIAPHSVLYIHPAQVHRIIRFEEATITSGIITSENILPDHLQLLEDLAPAGVLALPEDAFFILARTASLCTGLLQRQEEKLYDAILKQSCNTLIVLILSQYLTQARTVNSPSRFDTVARAFRSLLEQRFAVDKSPASYARQLNLSAPYLNECVRNSTGMPVSQHIQERVVLEAKRLLFHSSRSVKEIAGELGYDDYSYFTRLFRRVTGMTPLAFRRKNFG